MIKHLLDEAKIQIFATQRYIDQPEPNFKYCAEKVNNKCFWIWWIPSRFYQKIWLDLKQLKYIEFNPIPHGGGGGGVEVPSTKFLECKTFVRKQ